MANNVPTILANAITAKEKGIGQAFIVLAAEAAERFQRGGGAAARMTVYAHAAPQYSAAQQTASIPRPTPASSAPVLATAAPQYSAVQNYAAQTSQIRSASASYSSQPTAEQFAYAQHMLSLQAAQAAQMQ